MKLNFAINYGTKSERSIKGKLNGETLAEMKRYLDEAIELLGKNHIDSVTICCALEVEEEEN